MGKSWLCVEDVRRWCRESDDEQTLETLRVLCAAAEKKVAAYLSRPVVSSASYLKAQPDAVVADDCIRLAAKQLISHWNENREAAGEKKMNELPLGVDFLLREYRRRWHT